MPAYSFEALTADGQIRGGVLQADSARAARNQLRAQALVPVMVEAVGASAVASGVSDEAPMQTTGLLKRGFFAKQAFSSADLAIWTRQLAGLVSSGLPLERALNSLSDESAIEQQRNLIAALRAEVNGGASFAAALRQHRSEFSEVFIAVIGAGEQSGSLGAVLEKLADDMEEQQALKAKLLAAVLYPAIVTLVAIVIVTFLLGYVVPQVANVFAGSKRALPLLTVVMLAAGNFVRDYGWLVLIALVGGVFLLRLARRNSDIRERMDAAWLDVPVLGRLAQGYNAARFTGTLAILTGAGVPILRALQAAADTLANRAMHADALQIMVLVREGAPLASALAQKKRFPGLLNMFARLGEQTGQLPLMLDRAARQLSQEVQRRSIQLATIAEPLLIVLMGLVVMLIVLAVLLPIIQLNQLVK
jgi:general secretion pathway protein F